MYTFFECNFEYKKTTNMRTDAFLITIIIACSNMFDHISDVIDDASIYIHLFSAAINWLIRNHSNNLLHISTIFV